jgi:Zn finger protein HypA/HybF involved in hydrogenase expression
MYESTSLFKALKMSYEQIDAYVNGCVLFRKEHANATQCPKCKSSRFEEVPAADGQMKQADIAQKIIRYLPFVPRIQRLHMTEEIAK